MGSNIILKIFICACSCGMWKCLCVHDTSICVHLCVVYVCIYVFMCVHMSPCAYTHVVSEWHSPLHELGTWHYPLLVVYWVKLKESIGI